MTSGGARVPIRIATPEDYRRFWKHVDVKDADECWPWKLALTAEGYGKFAVRKRSRHGHALVYEMTRGHVSVGWIVHHTCHVRHCMNPSHLAAMSRAEHGRMHAIEQRGSDGVHCPRGHEYSTQVGQKRCQQCQNEKRWASGIVPRGPRGPYKKRTDFWALNGFERSNDDKETCHDL